MTERFISARATGNFTPSRRKANSNGLSRPARGLILHRRLPGTGRFISARGMQIFTRSIPTAQRNGFLPRATSLFRHRQLGRTERFTSVRTTRSFTRLKPDGKLLWSFTTGAPIISSPAINPDGVIYFTSTDGNLYALRPDGSERWRLHTGGVTESSPVLDESGNLYLMVHGACLRQLTRRKKTVGLVFAGPRKCHSRRGRKRRGLFFRAVAEGCSPFKATAPICGTSPRTRISPLRRSLAATEPFISATACFCTPSIQPTGWRRRRRVRGRCFAPTPVTPAGCKA
jgi:hypothetical protein